MPKGKLVLRPFSLGTSRVERAEAMQSEVQQSVQCIGTANQPTTAAYLTKKGAASYCSLSVRTLDYARMAGTLPYILVGRRVLLKVADLDRWLRQLRVAVDESHTEGVESEQGTPINMPDARHCVVCEKRIDSQSRSRDRLASIGQRGQGQ
jgi:excisionase family DNA binding protein